MARGETEPIGQLLVDRGWISTEQLAAALDRQLQQGGHLDTALLELSAVPEQRLVKALAEQGKLAPAEADDLRDVPQAVLDLLPAKLAIRHRAVPYRLGRGRVDLAVCQEPDIPALDELSFVLGRRVVLHIAGEARIVEALARHYAGEMPPRFANLLDRLDQPVRSEAAGAPPEKPAGAAGAAPAEAVAGPAPVGGVAAGTAPAVASPPSPPRPTSVPLSPDEKKSLRRLASRDSVKPLSQKAVQAGLESARRADDIGLALLGFLGQEFLRLLLFRVGQGKVRGWIGRSPALDEYRFRNWAVGFDEPSVFLNLRQGAEFFLGKLPPMPAHERLLRCWRGAADTECAVFPIRVRDRLVCAIYGDRDSLGLVGLDVPAIQRLTSKAAIAFEMLLMQRKLRS